VLLFTWVSLTLPIIAYRQAKPIVFWKEKEIIIDDHHRFSICRRNSLEYPVIELSFPDKEAVKAWIAENQLLLRRNANDPTTWYLRGVWYEAHRNTHGGDHKSQSKPHDEVRDFFQKYLRTRS
jgi:ParB-like chromosome segregation protein Spo0J